MHHFLAINKPLAYLRDILLPRRCYGCGVLVAECGLCARCWTQLDLITYPCAWCGRSFQMASLKGQICLSCHKNPPPWRRARAVFFYRGIGRHLILRYKHARQLEASTYYARLLARAAHDSLQDCHVILPVPLHWSRRLKRGYNQAAELARALAQQTGLPVLNHALIRTRRTKPQFVSITYDKKFDTQQAYALRQRNVKDAFAITKKYQPALQDKNILIIDDLITSGATAEACTLTLQQAGARNIDIAALARVGKHLT